MIDFWESSQLLCAMGKSGNHCIRTYLSFIQHKSLEIICDPRATSFGWFETIIIFKNNEPVDLSSFAWWIGNKHIEGQIFMSDGWESCLYTVIPSLPLGHFHLLNLYEPHFPSCLARKQSNWRPKAPRSMAIRRHVDVSY